jgi:hypothetical protein
MYSYILEKKLKSQKFILVLGGSNLKLSKNLGKNIVKKSRLLVSQIITKSNPPHNGCPTKIKKRKKNKGRNRRLKRFLNTTNKKLSNAKDPNNDSTLLKNYYIDNSKEWLKTELKKAIMKRNK